MFAAVDMRGMRLVALASLEHNHNENPAAQPDILGSGAAGRHIHFGNLALVEPEVVAMYGSPDSVNGLAMCCYADCGSDHCSWNFDFGDCDFEHGMVMVNADCADCCNNHAVDRG